MYSRSSLPPPLLPVDSPSPGGLYFHSAPHLLLRLLNLKVPPVLVAERHGSLLSVEVKDGVKLMRHRVTGGCPAHQGVLPLLLLPRVNLPPANLCLALLARGARGREDDNLLVFSRGGGKRDKNGGAEVCVKW